MKIKTFIAEDEGHSLDRLKDLLKQFEELELTGEAYDGREAVEKINQLKPDLIFLDIQMPEFNGFEVLERVQYTPMVIFVTAYNQYAIKAFEDNAIDYILKPTKKERIAKAVRRVIELNRKVDGSIIDKIKQIVQKKQYLKRFTVKSGEEILILPDSEIYFFKAEDKYNFLYTNGQRYFCDFTLKELESSLDPDRFFRIHKSTIVSLDKIKKIKKWFHGNFLVQMKDLNKTKLKISRSYLSSFRDKLNF